MNTTDTTLPPLNAAPITDMRPTGPEDNPCAKLMGTTRIAGASFHVEADEVVSNDEGEQTFVLPESEHYGEDVLRIVDGAAETVELLPGRHYVLHITPFQD